jgi:UDP-glucose 4-epimerase
LKAVGESVVNPLKYYNVNVGGSISLLSAMYKAKYNTIVFSSSPTVYDLPQYLPYDEKHSTNPVNTYGRTKLIIECHSYELQFLPAFPLNPLKSICVDLIHMFQQ